jgi:hypothetical protein
MKGEKRSVSRYSSRKAANTDGREKILASQQVSLPRNYLKNKVRVQGKARSGEKADHTRVACEHFEPFRKASMGT